MKKLFTNRYLYIGLAVLICMFMVGLKLYRLQIVNGEAYEAKVQTKNMASVTVDARRGNIYDRNGVLLAGSRTAYKLQLTYVNKPQAERDAMYLSLLNLLEKNGDIYDNQLEPYINSAFQWGSALAGDENITKRSSWIKTIVKNKEDKDKLNTPIEVFNYMRETVFEIDSSYTDLEAYKIMTIRYATRLNGLSTLVPMTLSDDISEESMRAIETGYLSYPGVYTDITYKRVYYYPELTSHIVGYVRNIDEEEYEELKDKGYSHTDLVGKIGIEKSCESLLRGKDGYRTVYYDSEAGVVRTSETVEPVHGDDIYLTIDINYQQVAYEAVIANINNARALKNPADTNYGDACAGCAIMEDVNTGAILAMANYPSYDNNWFVAPSSDREAQEAIEQMFADTNSPGLNRATQGLYPVGSTFKPVSAIAAMETKSISGRWQQETCTGVLVLEGMEHKCLGSHGTITMDTAFALSCNSYFQQLALTNGVGVENLDRYAKMLGLGEKTGIEIGEYAGYRSNRETMAIKEADKTHIWGISDTAQTAIGQLYTQFTPLQLCNYAAALGNGGYRNQPTLILKSVAADGTVTENQYNNRVKLDISDETLDAVKAGMKSVVDTTTTSAHAAFKDFPEGFVAAKTGSPQTGLEALGQSSHSAVISYAPADDPEIAVSVFVEHGAWGRNSLSTVATMMSKYFGIESEAEPTPTPAAQTGDAVQGPSGIPSD